MRTAATAATVGLLCLGSCTSLTMAEPQILVSPYLAVYQLRGEVGMQSQPVPGGPLQENAPQSARTLGQDHHHEDLGVRVDIGDGFGGFRVDYYRLDMGTSQPGALGADFGSLFATDVVALNAVMDDLRLGYLEPLFELETEYREQPLKLRFAAGGVLAHRSMDLRVRTSDGQRSQNVSADGDVFFPAVRAQVSWREFALDVDYALSPDLTLGGDFGGMQQDLEARLSYTLPLRDVTFFGGYRYSEFPSKGTTDGFRYDADLKLDGFQFGLVLTF
jgi:hypothetical protein